MLPGAASLGGPGSRFSAPSPQSIEEAPPVQVRRTVSNARKNAALPSVCESTPKARDPEDAKTERGAYPMLAKFLLCNLGATAIEYRMTASLIGMVMIGAAGLNKGLQQSAMSGPAYGARRDLFQRLGECRGLTS